MTKSISRRSSTWTSKRNIADRGQKMLSSSLSKQTSIDRCPRRSRVRRLHLGDEARTISLALSRRARIRKLQRWHVSPDSASRYALYNSLLDVGNGGGCRWEVGDRRRADDGGRGAAGRRLVGERWGLGAAAAEVGDGRGAGDGGDARR